VVIQFDEVAGLFPAGMIHAMVAGYQSLLDRLVGDEAGSRPTTPRPNWMSPGSRTRSSSKHAANRTPPR
jgi:hypothetical protein